LLRGETPYTLNKPGENMIDLELDRSYFKVLEDGSSEFEYVVNQLLPIEMQDDFDLGDYVRAYTDGYYLTLFTYENEEKIIEI
jgi:hypothetical protein